MMWLKSLLAGIVVCQAAFGVAALRVRVSPSVVYAGDVVSLEVESDGKRLQSVDYRFSGETQEVGRAQQTMIVNGVQSSSLQYSLLVETPGTYRLERLVGVMVDGSQEVYAEHPEFVAKQLETDGAVQVSARVKGGAAALLSGDSFEVVVEAEAPGVVLDGKVNSPFFEQDLFGNMRARWPKVSFRSELGNEAPIQLQARPTGEGPEVVEGADGAPARLRWRWRFPYVAVRTGKQLIPAPVLRDRRLVEVNAEGKPLFARCAAIGTALEIEVVPPPVEGRPEGFVGAVGRRFSAQVAVDEQNVKMGDPVAVRVCFETDCDPALVRAPELAVPEGFRAYGEVSRESVEGGVAFLYHWRPIRAGLLEVPPMRFAWFDRAERVYREAWSQAVPLRVRPSAQLVLMDASGAQAWQLLPPALRLCGGVCARGEAAEGGCADCAQPRRWPRWGWLVTVGVLAGLLGVSLLAEPVGRLVGWVWARGARGRVQGRALRALRRAKTAEAAVEAVRAWAGSPALTAGELRARLPKSAAADEVVAAYGELEAAVYAGRGDWVRARERLWQGLAQVKRLVGCVLLVVAGLAGGGAFGADAFVREQAEALSIEAVSPEAYQAAAQVWLRVVEEGDESRAALQNGAACSLLGRAPQTALALVRRDVWLHGWEARDAQLLGAVYEQLGEAMPFWMAWWHVWPGVGAAADGGCALLAGVMALLLVWRGLRRWRGRAVAVGLALWMAQVGQGAISRAEWQITPASPVYVGQPYELALMVETEADEEIAGIRVDQGPQRVPEQRVEQRDGKRQTRFVWEMQEDTPRLEAIPQAHLVASLAKVVSIHFARTAFTTTVQAVVPEFSYEVVALPEEARGAAVGEFELTLTGNEGAFRPGDVREVTVVLRALSGGIPAEMAFAWVGAEAFPGRIYPFREVERTRKQVIAKAWVVPEETVSEARLELAPLKVFDVQTRAIRELRAPVLTLAARAAAEEADAQAQGRGEPVLLRFAPSERAPVLGTLAAPWQVKQVYGEAWAYVETPSGSGWVPVRAVEGAAQEGAQE